MRNELPERLRNVLASDCWPEDWPYDAVFLIEYFQDESEKAEAELAYLRAALADDELAERIGCPGRPWRNGSRDAKAAKDAEDRQC